MVWSKEPPSTADFRLNVVDLVDKADFTHKIHDVNGL